MHHPAQAPLMDTILSLHKDVEKKVTWIRATDKEWLVKSGVTVAH